VARVTGWIGVDVGGVWLTADSDGVLFSGKGNIREAALTIVFKAKKSGRGIALEDCWHKPEEGKPWVRVWAEIHTLAKANGVPVIEVTAAYTSITCPRCSHCDQGNRPTRGRFRCLSCAFEGHADVIAAMNIAQSARRKAWAKDINRNRRKKPKKVQPRPTLAERKAQREAQRELNRREKARIELLKSIHVPDPFAAGVRWRAGAGNERPASPKRPKGEVCKHDLPLGSCGSCAKPIKRRRPLPTNR